MAKKFFGTDGIRGLTNKHPMTAEIAMKVGQAAGRRGPQASCGDRQGHTAFGIYDGKRAGGRIYQRRHGCRAGRPDADPGRGFADPVNARRSRCHDLRQP